MKTFVLAISLCAVLAACGGDDGGIGDGGGGDATDRTFDYGDPTPASPAQAMVLQGELSTIASLSASPSAAGAITLASINGVTSSLLGSPLGGPTAGQARAALSMGPGDDCIAVTATSITYDDCEFTSGGITTTTDGEFRTDGDGRFRWDLTVTSESTFGTYRSSGVYHLSGTITLADGSIRGEMGAELSATTQTGETSVSYAMSEVLIVDLDYQLDPPCIVGGTLEARRVWTERPAGLPASSAPDRAVLITWTGCGAATIQTSR